MFDPANTQPLPEDSDDSDGGVSALAEDLAADHTPTDDPTTDESGTGATAPTRPVGAPADRLLRLLAGSSEPATLLDRPGSPAAWFLLTLAGVARNADLPTPSRQTAREVAKMAVCTGLAPVGEGTLDTEVLNVSGLLSAGYMVLRHPDCEPEYAVQLASLDPWMQALTIARPGTLITEHTHLRAWLDAQRNPWEVHKYLVSAAREFTCDRRTFTLPHQITEVFTEQILTSARLRVLLGSGADSQVTAAGSILLAEALAGPRTASLPDVDTAVWAPVADALGVIYLDLCQRLREITHAAATVDAWDNAWLTAVVTHAADGTDAALTQIAQAIPLPDADPAAVVPGGSGQSQVPVAAM